MIIDGNLYSRNRQSRLFNTLADNKFLDFSKLKDSADGKNACDRKNVICSGKGRKHCGKRRKCLNNINEGGFEHIFGGQYYKHVLNPPPPHYFFQEF